MHLLRESSRGNWLVWSVLVSMAFGCDLGAQKQRATDEAHTTSAKESEAKLTNAKSEEERARIRAEAAAARQGALGVQSGRFAERRAPAAAPPPAAPASPAKASRVPKTPHC